VIECVDRAMDVLGQESKKVLYYHLEKGFGVRRSDIVDRPQEFVNALRSIFGTGAYVLEKAIVKEIQMASDVFIESDDLVKTVKEISLQYARRKKK